VSYRGPTCDKQSTPAADQGLVYAWGEKFTILSFRFPPSTQEIIAFVNALALANSSPVINVKRALICEMHPGTDLDQVLEGNPNPTDRILHLQ